MTCLVGRTRGSAADAPVGLLTPCKVLTSLFRQRDEGVRPQRGPQDQGVRPTTSAGFAALAKTE
jgi:hypothetical protein